MKRALKQEPRMHWSLPQLMTGLHERVERDLRVAHDSVGHPAMLGEASQNVWIRLFETYLPQRYQSRSGVVVDSLGHFSDQIDVILYDRQYSSLMLQSDGQCVIPVEAVYAVFESKQQMRSEWVHYAQEKIASVRRLHRTSIQIPTISGPRTKEPHEIIGGFLALQGRRPATLSHSMLGTLAGEQGVGRLDLGCIASEGTFGCGGADSCTTTPSAYATTTFLLELLSRLQACGTVPAIDYRAYAKWLDHPEH